MLVVLYGQFMMHGQRNIKLPLQRSRCRWDNNIKLNLTEILWGMDRINLAWDKV